ncbi:MAG: phytoene/squalene synthase family protein [Pseudomonadota bacterium]|nr:phytoene/squalene synthase family protein [Pseudomonadota bacterium]
MTAASQCRSASRPRPAADRHADEAYQRHSLQGVSRTFALTIPVLPEALCRVVGNAYLLCRIADTIEDEATLSAAQKQVFHREFIAVVRGEAPADGFAARLSPLLSDRTLAAERDLIRHTAAVIRLTHGFNPAQRQALERCAALMGEGMERFGRHASRQGLHDLPALDWYCYYVAGVVGEMLTELFCDYSPAIARHRPQLLPLAVSFGQGLQMTNILKDIWEDHRRGVCWLPRDVFQRAGFDLPGLNAGDYRPAFGDGLRELVGIARGHLRNALEYTLLIPKTEPGIRKFCLWAIGMAVLTLRRISRHPDFTAGRQVKISRAGVRATIAATHWAVGNDSLLRVLFYGAALGLPAAAPGAYSLPSRWHGQAAPSLPDPADRSAGKPKNPIPQ